MSRDFLVHPAQAKKVEWHFRERPSLADLLEAAKKEFPRVIPEKLEVDVEVRSALVDGGGDHYAIILTERSQG